MFMNTTFFIYSPVNEYLSYFYFGGTINNVVWTFICKFQSWHVFILPKDIAIGNRITEP